jgi:hypothetical protein
MSFYIILGLFCVIFVVFVKMTLPVHPRDEKTRKNTKKCENTCFFMFFMCFLEGHFDPKELHDKNNTLFHTFYFRKNMKIRQG